MRLGSQRALGACAAAFLAVAACAAEAPQAVFIGSYDWPASAHGLGGFSGLEVSGDGADFVAISDRGQIVSGAFRREDGRISGVDTRSAEPLLSRRGTPLAKPAYDAEGLAMAPDGRVFVSFESRHRVWAYDGGQVAASLGPDDPAFDSVDGNAGFEALAIDAAGSLYMIPEKSGRLDRAFPIYRFDGRGWVQLPQATLPRSEGFLPVGADFGPDGRLYVLERNFTGLGFRSRVRRLSVEGGPVETVLTSALLRHGNLEGLAVWRDGAGRTRLTMISDDNFNSLQRSEFVEYALP